MTLLKRAKMALTKKMPLLDHSKAGRKHLLRKKTKPKKKKTKAEEIKATRLSRGSQRQLSELHSDDYKAVMKMLHQKPKKRK